jgi:hypothetical protein
MNIKLKELLLKEQLSVADVRLLEKASTAFAETLIKDKILQSYHQHMTSADVNISDYVEDLAEVVRDEVISWVNTVNARGGR